MATEPQQQSTRDTFLRTIAILGLIAVLLLGAWGIITLAVNLPNILGSISTAFTSSSTETVTVSAPQNATSGAPLSISWTHQNGSGQYSYNLSYSCATGVTVKAPVPTGAYQSVSCNTPFNYTNATGQTTLIPTLSGSASVPITITVTATNLSTGAISASGNTMVTVNAAQVAQTQSASVSTAPSVSYYPSSHPVASFYGYPDLEVIINSVTPVGSLESVNFTIANVGTNVAPRGWTFDAILPINGSYTFSSQPQRALYPGDRIIYTLNFPRPYNPYTYGSQTPCVYTYTQPPFLYPSVNNPYTCNNYGPCDIPGYENLYPYGSPYANYYSCPEYGYGYSSYGEESIGTVTITADPYDLIPESNRTNSTASAPVY